MLASIFQDLPFSEPGMGSTTGFLAIVAFIAVCAVQAAAGFRRSLVTAVRASPMPVPWNIGAEPILLLPFHAPNAWIVSVYVAGALAGHIIAVRKLLA